MSSPIWLLAKSRLRQFGCGPADEWHSQSALIESCFTRHLRLRIAPALRTVASTITFAKEVSTWSRMTLSIFHRWKMRLKSTRRVQSNPGCWSTASKSVMARSPNIWCRAVTSRLPSLRRRTTAQTLDMPSSCSRAGGAATTFCACIGLPDLGSSRMWAGSWRSSAWPTGSKDLWRSRSPLRTLRRPTPAWRGASRCDDQVPKRRKDPGVLVCLTLSSTIHQGGQERQR